MAEYKVVDAEKLDADLASVADAIRTKGGTSESLTFPQGFVDAVDAISSGGGDNLLQYATFRNGNQVFSGAVFPDNYHLDFKIKGNNSSFHIQYFFSYSNAKEITLQIDTVPTGGISVYYAFGGCTKLTKITCENTPLITEFATCFIDCTMLETVNASFDLSKSKNNAKAFEKCYKLKDIWFIKNSIMVSIGFGSCLELSAESLQSIIDGLATVETAQTLTLHADVKAKLTETQLATITSKNWNLA